MRVDVRYFTKNGGTKKLADAIANAVGAEAKTVDVPLEKYADVVFLWAPASMAASPTRRW